MCEFQFILAASCQIAIQFLKFSRSDFVFIYNHIHYFWLRWRPNLLHSSAIFERRFSRYSRLLAKMTMSSVYLMLSSSNICTPSCVSSMVSRTRTVFVSNIFIKSPDLIECIFGSRKTVILLCHRWHLCIARRESVVNKEPHIGMNDVFIYLKSFELHHILFICCRI